MSNLLETLILVLPGLVSVYVQSAIGPARDRPPSDYERTVLGLACNIPALLVAWGALSLRQRKSMSLQDFESAVLHMPCILYYLVFSLIAAWFLAVVWDGYLREMFTRVTNSYRAGRRPRSSPETVWEQFFGPEPEAFIRIYPIGERDKFVLGNVRAGWRPGDVDKAILFDATEELRLWDGWFGNPERTYVDTVTKMVYEWYPASAWADAQRRAEEYQASLTSLEEPEEEGSA
ncbi:MAG: DUF6338 family protein [Alicyclobacillus macrosporangiidus]|nr:DUF6338 family protein [Alicyclobacillus macrosporangiidus]